MSIIQSTIPEELREFYEPLSPRDAEFSATETLTYHPLNDAGFPSGLPV